MEKEEKGTDKTPPEEMKCDLEKKQVIFTVSTMAKKEFV